MASQLQETLRILCCRTKWSYAIFWRLKHQILEWEAGYCKPRELLTSALPFPAPSSDNGAEMNGAKAAYHMFNTKYGIIGQVASSQTHKWISTSLDKEHPAEFHEQFVAGVQTVAVIAVHQGVLQLGSTTVTAEDLNFVRNVKTLFSKDLSTAEGADIIMASKMDDTLEEVFQTFLEDARTKHVTDMPQVWHDKVAASLKDSVIASLTAEEDTVVKSKQMRCRNSKPIYFEQVGSLRLSMNGHLPSFWDYDCSQHSLEWNRPVSQEFEDCMSTSCQTAETDMFQMGASDGIENSQSNDWPMIGHGSSAKDLPQGPKQREALFSRASATIAGKKRTREGEKPVQRPKDRKRIQGCLHELRSIIPDSGKCTIDVLLEKTIKYVSFLQSIARDVGMASDYNAQFKIQLWE